MNNKFGTEVTNCLHVVIITIVVKKHVNKTVSCK